MRAALTEQTAEKAAQYAAHTERLEQRVRVLERIVTDKGIERRRRDRAAARRAPAELSATGERRKSNAKQPHRW